MDTLEPSEAELTANVTYEEIAQLAYRYWDTAGRPTDREVDFWLQAEADLRWVRNRDAKAGSDDDSA